MTESVAGDEVVITLEVFAFKMIIGSWTISIKKIYKESNTMAGVDQHFPPVCFCVSKHCLKLELYLFRPQTATYSKGQVSRQGCGGKQNADQTKQVREQVRRQSRNTQRRQGEKKTSKETRQRTAIVQITNWENL